MVTIGELEGGNDVSCEKNYTESTFWLYSSLSSFLFATVVVQGHY